MNTIIRMIKDFLLYVSNPKVRELRKCKKQALLLAELNNEKVWVLPDWQGRYRVLNRDSIKLLKKKGILAKGVNFYNLEKEALYIAEPPKVIRRRVIIRNK